MRPRIGQFLVGVGAGALALLMSYVIRADFGGAFLPEVAVNALVTQTPGTVESVLVTNLESLAKYSAFTAAIAINLVLYGLLSVALMGIARRVRSFTDRASLYSFAAYGVILALTIVFLALTQVLSTPQPLPMVVLALLPSAFVYGVALAAEERFVLMEEGGVICEPPEPLQPSAGGKGFAKKRRLLIKAGVATAVAGVLLYYGVNLLFPRQPGGATAGGADPVSALYNQEVTTNDDFYRVDVNIFPPSVDGNTWSLRVYGLVNNPATLNYSQLNAMNPVEQYNTLECVSNNIGGDLISTAKWKGVKLKDLLQFAQAQPQATYVVFRSADGYSVGIPMEKALLDGTILAYEMNGASLPQGHGFPVRAIVPGYYGMMNAKWITSIELVNAVYQGYWQERGWANEAKYQTGSEIVTPGNSQVAGRFNIPGASQLPSGANVPIAGIAFAGDRGIEKVEVSMDGGQTWQPASVKDPLSGNTWVLWRAQWNPPSKGNYRLAVRATDKTGAVQTAVMADPFPSGATGYHIVDVGIA